MRRLSVLSMVFVLLLAVPGVALGARADRFSQDAVFLSCDGIPTSSGGTLFLAVDVVAGEGSFGAFAWWAPGTVPFESDPTLVSGDSLVSLVGVDLSVTFETFTFDPTNDPPLGDKLDPSQLDATLEPVGEPEAFSDRLKEGNRLVRREGTRQMLAVEGELTMPEGETADLADGCFAEHEVITFFGNNPARDAASLTFRREGISLSCQWQVDGLLVELFADTDPFGAFSGLFVNVDESFAFGFSEDTILTRTTFSASYDIFEEDPEGEGDQIGSADASAQLTPTGERINLNDQFGRDRFRFNGERLAVDGTLDLDLGDPLSLPMNDERCMAMDGRFTEHTVQPRGPRPRPLSNDTPEDAEPLAIGGRDRLITGANAPEPEASCLIEGDPIPIMYTAWWTFTGTGDDVTISTAGSTFDTVVGVYQLVGDELVQVACVDDVLEPEFSLQASVTVGTDASETYYIQAGGFFESTGRLIISLN